MRPENQRRLQYPPVKACTARRLRVPLIDRTDFSTGVLFRRRTIVAFWMLSHRTSHPFVKSQPPARHGYGVPPFTTLLASSPPESDSLLRGEDAPLPISAAVLVVKKRAPCELFDSRPLGLRPVSRGTAVGAAEPVTISDHRASSRPLEVNP